MCLLVHNLGVQISDHWFRHLFLQLGCACTLYYRLQERSNLLIFAVVFVVSNLCEAVLLVSIHDGWFFGGWWIVEPLPRRPNLDFNGEVIPNILDVNLYTFFTFPDQWFFLLKIVLQTLLQTLLPYLDCRPAWYLDNIAEFSVYQPAANDQCG